MHQNPQFHTQPSMAFIYYIPQQIQLRNQIQPRVSLQNQILLQPSLQHQHNTQQQIDHHYSNVQLIPIIRHPVQQQSSQIKYQNTQYSNYLPYVQQQQSQIITKSKAIQEQQTRPIQNQQKQDYSQNKVIQPSPQKPSKHLIPNQAISQSPSFQNHPKIKHNQEEVKKLSQQLKSSLKDDKLEKKVDGIVKSNLIQEQQSKLEQGQEQEQEQQQKQQQKQQSKQEQEQKSNQPQVKVNQLQELVLQYENGYIYRGQGYIPATREGQGILTDQNNKTIYDGLWHDNQYHGKGKLINIQAEEIEGPFDYQDLTVIENGWSDYEGYFCKGQMNREGKLTLTNEEVLEGKFQDGIINGYGNFKTNNGQILKGFWEKGILIKVND